MPRDDDDELEVDEGNQGLRPFWSGTLTFGLVSVPVELYSALGTSKVRMHLLSSEGHPLRRRYVSSEDQTPLEPEQIVRGWESDAGKWVTVSDEELASLEPKRSREIDLRRFVDRTTIDPLYGDKSYVLLPAGEVTKPYRLLAAIMEKSGRAGIATFVMRGREYAIAIHAAGGILRAETLRQPRAIRTPAQVGLPEPREPDPEMVKKLVKAIGTHGKRTLDTTQLTDEDAAALRGLAAKKKKDTSALVDVPEELVTTKDHVDADAPIVDLVAILKERLGTAARAKPRRRASRA